MNFDTKINRAYSDFIKAQGDQPNVKQKASQSTLESKKSLRTLTSQELFTRDGAKVENKEEMFDDLIVRGPQAHR